MQKHALETIREAIQKAAPKDCTEIHIKACSLCPSTHDTDPECADIMLWPIENRLETIFPCAWRPSKFCKGYCDKMGISQTLLATRPTTNPTKK